MVLGIAGILCLCLFAARSRACSTSSAACDPATQFDFQTSSYADFDAFSAPEWGIADDTGQFKTRRVLVKKFRLYTPWTNPKRSPRDNLVDRTSGVSAYLTVLVGDTSLSAQSQAAALAEQVFDGRKLEIYASIRSMGP